MKNAKRKLLAFTILALAAVAIIVFLRVNDTKRYKLDYIDIVTEAATEYNVPPELIFAVIYSESSFDPNAKSKAGAQGLMQLLPSTFDEISVRLHEKPTKNDIFDAKTNIRFGTFYISYLYRYFGDYRTAIAAYNAGMGTVSSWLADSRYSTDGTALTSIPYSETKNYVNRVFAAEEKYKKLLKERKE
ncbi:MAG: lytic transglycosylase domain-containing protein [Clostridia bacterium]